MATAMRAIKATPPTTPPTIAPTGTLLPFDSSDEFKESEVEIGVVPALEEAGAAVESLWDSSVVLAILETTVVSKDRPTCPS